MAGQYLRLARPVVLSALALVPSDLAAAQDEGVSRAGACLGKRVALEIEHELEDKRAGGGIVVARGEGRARTPLSIEGDRIRGAAQLALKVRARSRQRNLACSASSVIDIAWKFDGRISDQCLIDFVVTRESTERRYVLDCGSMRPIFVPEMPTQTGQAQLQLKAEVGASAAHKIARDDYKQSTTFTIVEDPGSSADRPTQ